MTALATAIGTGITSNFNATDVVSVGVVVMGALAAIVVPLKIAPRWGTGLLRLVTRAIR